MKQKLLVLTAIVCSFLFSSVQAQINITIGTGTATNTNTTYPCPLQDWYEGSRAQYLFTASELLAAGMSPGNITAIKFTVVSADDFSGSLEEYAVRMASTTATSLGTSTWETVPTTPNFGPVNYVPVVGVNTITFTTPFFWNGTSNVVIDICNGDANNASSVTYTGNPLVTWTTGLSFNGSHTYRADNLGNLCGTATTDEAGTQTTRPNVIFTYTPASACTGTPTGGTATSTATSVCLGSSFTLSTTGSTVASGLTYQWQSAPSATGPWTDIAGATAFSLTTTQNASTFYRRVITCTAGNASANSTAIQVVSPSLVSGTFTINSGGTTALPNFQSFNAAYDYIKCGINGAVVFNVTGVTTPYNEQLIMQAVPGASATNTVTFNGNGRTIKYSSANSNERAVIKLDGADHIRFDSLTVDATPVGTGTTYGFGVQFINNADSNAVTRCNILTALNNTSTNYAGVVISAGATGATTTGATLCDSNTVANNTITGGYYGMTMVGSSTDAVQRNVYKNNIVKDFYLYGMYLSYTFAAQIEGNDISRPTATTVSSFYGAYVTGISVNLNFTRNRIHHPFTGAPTSTSGFYGVYLTGVDAVAGFENKFTNNLISDVNGNGLIYAFYNGSSDNNKYYHNTISIDNSAATTASSTYGFYQITSAAGIDFINNIITIGRGGTGTKYAMYFSTAASTITHNRNDYFIRPTTGGTANYIGYNGTNQATLAAWQSATTQDANSVSADPLFAAVASGNYRPTSAVVNDLGTPVGVAVDIENAGRSATTPDIGAYEFAVPPCTGTPVGGTAVTSATPVCAGTSFSLSVDNATLASGLTYQWQSAPSATGPWTNIPGATFVSLTTSQTVSTYYRRVTTCTAGNASANSTAIQVVSPALISGTFTINSGGTTALPNFQSFNAAYDYIKCGINGAVVFNVTGVTTPYNEQLIMQAVPGASATNTVTFNGNGRTIKYSSTNTDERAVIKLDGASHIRFDSLVIDATPVGTGTTYGFGFHFTNNADSNTLVRSRILTTVNSTSTNYAGVVMSAGGTSATITGATLCDSNTVANNTVIGGYYGMTMVGSSTDAVQRNVYKNNTVQDFYYYGIYSSYTFGSWIEGNNISRPNATTTSLFYGIYSTGISVNLNVSKNRIHDPFNGTPSSTSGFYGIYFTSVDAVSGFDNTVSNNLIYDIDGVGAIYGIYNASSDNVRYYHNTISFDNTSSVATGSTYGFYQVTTASGINFSNNIITIGRGGAGTKYAVYLSSGLNGMTLNRNVYFINAVSGNNNVGYNTSNQPTLAAWQTSTSQEANSVFTNPLYTNPATGNFMPRSVVVDNRGTGVGITTDILNAPRSTTTPDPGAYEFAVPPCTTPPTPGTSVAVPNTGICMGTEVALSLNGATSGSGQTVQWQYAANAAGPWTNLGGPLLFADTTIYATTTLYYRAILTCGGNSATSTPVLVSLNPAFLSGFYTINPGAPVSATNFQNFATAVAAMECGITGFVTFDVSPGTYTEKIRMHRINGAGPNSRVTFRSLTGVPSSVILTSAAATATANYTLQLDSASYITYKNMSIRNTNTTNSRVIDFSNTASYDSIANCVITAPVSTSTANTSAGIFSNTLIGSDIVIKGNTFVNGANGVYLAGASAALPTTRNVIDSNTVNGAYYYGIYTAYNNRMRVTKNTINTTAPLNTTAYSIYATTCDSAYQFVDNNVNISNTTSTVYGIYLTLCDAILAEKGRVANNKIQAITNNTGTLYGLYETSTTYNNTVNNTINIKTNGTTSYGIYSTTASYVNYWNNTVQNASTATGATNMAAYFAQTSATTNVQNNIFSHIGGGRAIGFTNASFVYSDYNMLYTTGSTLVSSTTPAGTYPTLQDWRDATTWDVNSIVFPPAFVSASDVRPNVADTNVWAMHGRGTQIVDNNYDINYNTRPTTLQAGVPDLGAYEFLPTSIPLRLVATPALPAAGTTQTFMLGTDTVTKITWPSGSAVPPSVTLRRYSGILPPGVPATSQRMYFYVDADTMPVGSYNATVKQYFIDPWQGFISNQAYIKMGKTILNGGSWVVNSQSVVNDIDNHITETAIPYLDKFTGLTDGNAAPPPPVVVSTGDSSNRGKEFWVGYGHNYYFNSGNSQDMIIYLSAEQAANVTIRVNGTPYSKTYAVPANTAIATTPIPKLGTSDARLLSEGLSSRGISITSDVPIVAYAHIYYSSSSGATMLLPVGTYGYEYTSLNTPQSYTSTDYSWVNVIAAYDSTVVTITPSNPTLGGRPANVPFTITMNKGDVYQVLGAIISGSNGYDMSGTKVVSIANAAGKCYPIAVFSGSSRTGYGCNGALGGNGDNMIQQNFPSQAWGRRYVVAPTSTSASANTLMTNIVRVAVKDPATVVTRNGVALTGLINNYYYQFETSSADYIQADKPIAVAQLEASSSSTCANTTGNGDPEMFYVSPIEQGIKKVVLYRNTVYGIDQQYVTLVIPTAGVTSLQIDGSNTFDYTYPVTGLPGYTVVVKRWGTASTGQTVITSDSAFTAITYGLGSVESYGYNAGTLVKNLNALPSINNTFNSVGNTSAYTCAKSPFKVTIRLPLRPTQLVWNFSALSNITPNNNVTQTTPVPSDSSLVNGVMYYSYTVTQDYVISDSGTYYIPVTYFSPSIEGCNNSITYQLPIVVRSTPKADFTANPLTACVGDGITFTGAGATAAYNINRWNWSFPDTTTSTQQTVVKAFNTPGVKSVKLQVITVEGCIGDTTKTVTINPKPTVALVRDSLSICPGTADTLKVSNPVTGVTYNWYNVATGGTPIANGATYPVTVTGTYYVEATQSGCTSARVRAVVNVYSQLATPVVSLDSAGTNFLRFRWNAINGAVSYSVSRDGGATWIVPSSGATGLTHTVQPLNPLDTASLMVRANGVNTCQNSTSLRVSARTLPDQIYIPNTFTPNGDGRNDMWMVYGYTVRSIQIAVFNQWGEKVFESTSQQTGWNGTYKGKQQPVGVYIYVVKMVLNDGSVMDKKGSINLVR